jgi:hypothetical protein
MRVPFRILGIAAVCFGVFASFPIVSQRFQITRDNSERRRIGMSLAIQGPGEHPLATVVFKANEADAN